jgi:putative DNA methylase
MHNADGPKGDADGTVSRNGAVSVIDGTPISLEYIREEARAGRMGAHLIAVVGENVGGRLYVSPTPEYAAAAQISRPDNVPTQELPEAALGFRVQNYGFKCWSDLFTNRQLIAMTTFSDLVAEAREQVLADSSSEAYADAVAVYLALAVSRLTDYSNCLCGWNANRDGLRDIFARPAIPMVWDYAEANPLSNSSGNFLGQTDWVSRTIELLPARFTAIVEQRNASSREYSNALVSTDPPYYDNIGYSDLSDFFYVWLRRTLRSVCPSLFETMLVPKSDELIANPFRHGGIVGAEQFFVNGFNSVFSQIRKSANCNRPLTVYYAYKQQDSESEGDSSTGWYTLLDGLIKSGWEITATLPVRSERGGRMRDIGSNALASSIVLACRLRPESAEATTRRAFISALRQELPQALRTMIQGSIAPVDLAQAAIGPGISVFSRYSRVREANGEDMSVRDALLLINQTLDEVMNEQETDFDPDTRFAVKWYRTYGWL